MSEKVVRSGHGLAAKADGHGRAVARLCRLASDGDETAFAQLVVLFEPQIRALARRVYWSGAEFDDFRQAGLIGLWRAVKSYDSGGGVEFESFAWWCIRRQIVTQRRMTARRGQITVTDALMLDGPRAVDGSSSTWYDVTADDIAFDPLARALERLALRDMLAAMSDHLSELEMRTLLAVADGAGYEAIAAWLDTKVKSVENAVGRARRNLRRGWSVPRVFADELDRRHVAGLYHDGWSARQIAEQTGFSTSAVYVVLREMGVARRRRGTRPRDVDSQEVVA